MNLAAQRVRSINQIHALSRRPDSGCSADGAQGQHSWDGSPQGPSQNTTGGDPQGNRVGPRARDPKYRSRLGAITAQMTEALHDYPIQLIEVDGIGPVLAVRLIGRCGRASRFPNADAFANYAGVAPVGVSSGERAVHRLSRSGDRKLNSALHLVAVTQVRMPNSAGRRNLRPQDQRRQDPQSSNALCKTQNRIPRLAAHSRRTNDAELASTDPKRTRLDKHSYL